MFIEWWIYTLQCCFWCLHTMWWDGVVQCWRTFRLPTSNHERRLYCLTLWFFYQKNGYLLNPESRRKRHLLELFPSWGNNIGEIMSMVEWRWSTDGLGIIIRISEMLIWSPPVPWSHSLIVREALEASTFWDLNNSFISTSSILPSRMTLTECCMFHRVNEFL